MKYECVEQRMVVDFSTSPLMQHLHRVGTAKKASSALFWGSPSEKRRKNTILAVRGKREAKGKACFVCLCVCSLAFRSKEQMCRERTRHEAITVTN